MLGNFQFPPQGFGPGSQPEDGDGQQLDYLAMPSGMRTFEGHMPEIEDADALAPALDLLAAVAGACDEAAAGAGQAFDLTALDAVNRRFVAETMGEGEVSCLIAGQSEVRAQESVFAGVWMVSGAGIDRIEVGPVPRDVTLRAFQSVEPAVGLLAARNPGVVNSPALITELMDQSQTWRAGQMPHVVNLSLLPHTPEDLEFLDIALGRGSVTMLSRGYGNCRVTATGLNHVWRVQFFNSMDTLILDTFEVTDVPEVAIAAREDFEDSAGRLREVLEAVQ